ncbi:hypothetical protein BpHYR1_011722 [Brachionus plicatilis]|uniref:Uncharacterized protein n=1 Tax=Brachionus plicatilis TaxID=10195 RepID=A0A3M7SKL8_BRAPC|nr:hypothetical protein BpHYR1_011722 [Brachionus plicatilis]
MASAEIVFRPLSQRPVKKGDVIQNFRLTFSFLLNLSLERSKGTSNKDIVCLACVCVDHRLGLKSSSWSIK